MPQQKTKEENEELPDQILLELDEFEEHLIDKKVADRTRNDYVGYVKGFYRKSLEKHNRTHPIEVEDAEDHEEVKQEMKEYIGSRATEYGLKSYIDYKMSNTGGQEENWLNLLKNSIGGMGGKQDKTSEKEKIRKAIRTPEQVNTIIEEAPARTQVLDKEELELFLRVMYETAGRASDILRLQIQDATENDFAGTRLDENQMVIEAERSKSKNSGIVNLKPSTWSELKRHIESLDNQDDEAWVFFQDREEEGYRKTYKKIRRPFRNTSLKDADVSKKKEPGTHDFRHSRLVHLGKRMLEDEDEDYSYADVKQRLMTYGRHQDEDITEIYIGILKERYAIDISKYQ